jgi:hypothetical protein
MVHMSEELAAATRAVMSAHDSLIGVSRLVELVLGEDPRTSSRREDRDAFFGLMWVAGELSLWGHYLDAHAVLKKALAAWTAALPKDKPADLR